MTSWRTNLLPFLGYSFVVGALFVAVYGTTNWLADQRAHTLKLYFDWELGIPFVPVFIVAYGSIALLLGLPLTALQRRQLQPYAKAFALATVIAGICFLLLPARVGFARPVAVPGFETLYTLLYWVDLPHNTAPSLHTTYSTLTVLAVSQDKSTPVRAVLWVWFAAIACSAVLTHQHHLADIVTGFILGALCYRRYLRLQIQSSPAGHQDNTTEATVPRNHG